MKAEYFLVKLLSLGLKDLSLVETVLIEEEISKKEPLVSLSATIPLTSANNIRI